MSEKGLWANVATLIKAKTNEGGLSVRAAEGLPFLLEEGMHVVFVPPVLRMPRAAHVISVEETAPDRFLVHFDGVSTRNDAELLEGHGCLVRIADLPEGYDADDSVDLTGFALIDAASDAEVGIVAGVEENPAHPLLVVRRPEAAEALVPLVDDLVESIDAEGRAIFLRIPAGLLDL